MNISYHFDSEPSLSREPSGGHFFNQLIREGSQFQNLLINISFLCIFFVFVASSVYWPFKTSTPSQSKIFFVIVVSSVYFHFKTNTHSQSEIFFVIVACSVYLAIQDQYTLPKWNIFVIVASSIYWPFKMSRPSQSEIFFQKLFLKLVLYIWHFKTSTPSQSEIFFVIVPCSVYSAFQGQHTLPKWNNFCSCSWRSFACLYCI